MYKYIVALITFPEYGPGSWILLEAHDNPEDALKAQKNYEDNPVLPDEDSFYTTIIERT